MNHESILTSINWSEELTRLKSVQNRDLSTYKWIAILSLAGSGLLLLSYPLLLIFSIPLAGFSYFTYLKNKKQEPYLVLCTINEKEHWHRPSSTVTRKDDPENVDNSFSLYLFKTSLVQTYSLGNIKPEKIESKKSMELVVVNSRLYKEFQAGESAFFIFSPANDLIGYLYDQKVILLLRTETLSNGELYSVSVSVPQEMSYPPGNGFQLLTE